MKNSWHNWSVSQIEKELETDVNKGLSMRRARQRAAAHSKSSSLFCAPYPSVFKSISAVVCDPVMVLLIAVSLMTVIFGGSLQGLFTLCLTLICAAICVVMDYVSRKRSKAASDYSSPLVRVIRGGDKFYVDGTSVAPGDVILLGTGDLVPCDARIVECRDLAVKELIHTKSGVRNRTVDKASIDYNENDNVFAPDAINMLYAGSAIMSGTVKAIVTDVGEDAYLSVYLEGGELSRACGERAAAREIRSVVTRIRLVSLCAAPILLLISLLTMGGGELANGFMLIAAAMALVSSEVLTVGVRYVNAAYLYRLLPGQNRARKAGDLCAAIKSPYAADKLSGVDSLILMGRAGITQSDYKIAGVYTAEGLKDSFSAENEHHNRLLTLIYTYVKTLEAKGNDQDVVSGKIGETLVEFVKSCGFDHSAADIFLHSLYYVDDGNRGYVCAEAIERQFRVALTEDDEILDYCSHTRFESGPEEMGELDRGYIRSICDKTRKKGGMCLYVVSEDSGVGTLEGVIALEQPIADGLDWSLSTLEQMGIDTYIFLDNEEQAAIISDSELRDKILLASQADCADISSEYESFRAFAGFDKQQYCELIDRMKLQGKRIAVYGISNENNDLFAKADVVISCDDLKYETAKHKDSAYAENLKGGSEGHARCSSQTRLLAGVIVRRSNSRGGGVTSLINAIKASREVNTSIAIALRMLCNIMCFTLPFALITLISGAWLISPFQMVSLAAVAAVLPFLLFAEGGCKPLNDVRDQTLRSTFLHGSVGMLARTIASTVIAILAVILHYTDAIGENVGFMGVTFVAILLVLFVEMALMEKDYTEKGSARRNRWMYVMIAYAVMLFIMGISTQEVFVNALYPTGVTLIEFILLPVYLAAFAVAIFVSRAVKRNKR